MLMRFNTKGTQPKARNRATNPAAQHLLVPPPQTRAVHHHPQLLELSVPPASLRAGGVQGEGQHRAHCHELQGVPWGFILSTVIPNFRMPRCRGVQLHTTAPTCRKYFFSSTALDSERTKPAGQKASLPRVWAARCAHQHSSWNPRNRNKPPAPS